MNKALILNRIKEYNDFKTDKELASFLGISKSTLSNWYNRNSIDYDLVFSKCVQIDKNWLLTGKGKMLKEEKESDIIINPIVINRKTKDSLKEIQEIPLYNLHATAGLVELFKGSNQDAIIDNIKIPGIASCDGAVYVSGDSMYPLLKSGDIVLYKEVDISRLFWGEMYLLSIQLDDWSEYITIKYIQKSELGEDYIKLVSQNQHHQPKDEPIKNIQALALIRASIRIQSS
ncbi:peptidase S24 [Apibacter muscae]|uniref:Peptidase S24 n=1 Tax=Apibacter muscae TaxID=2509004 RepID=A0A563DK14_9FLAO|nr:helix-turn-helix domain-containing protein [Apibacter muscae]TWP30545.1 peptidase S24 [Apibacter muscae]TWP31265.1 peptidase S24 [Apibacter muscae]